MVYVPVLPTWLRNLQRNLPSLRGQEFEIDIGYLGCRLGKNGGQIDKLTYLRRAEHHSPHPSRDNHIFLPSIDVCELQGFKHGVIPKMIRDCFLSQNPSGVKLKVYLPIDADAAEHQAGQVKAESSEKAHYSAHGVSGYPFNSGCPCNFHWHHQKCYLETQENLPKDVFRDQNQRSILFDERLLFSGAQLDQNQSES